MRHIIMILFFSTLPYSEEREKVRKSHLLMLKICYLNVKREIFVLEKHKMKQQKISLF